MKSAHRTGLLAPGARFGSDEMLGDIKSDAKSGNAEGDRYGGVQKAAEEFVEFGECHGIVPYCWLAVAGEPSIDQIRCVAMRIAMPNNGMTNGSARAACRKLLIFSSSKMVIGVHPSLGSP